MSRPQPKLLTIRFAVESAREFVCRHYPDALKGGIFVHTVHAPPLQVGTRLALRFQTQSGRDFFGGTGQVVWVQRQPGREGLGIRFEDLPPSAERLHRQLLARQARQQQPSSEHAEFADHPTRKMARARRQPPPPPPRQTAPEPPPIPRICVEPSVSSDDPTATAIVVERAKLG